MAEEKKKKPPVIVDGEDITDMPWTKLMAKTVDMLDKLILERGERVRVRLECEIVRTAWHNMEDELEIATATFYKKHLEGEVFNPDDETGAVMREQEIKYLKYALDLDMKEWEEKVEGKFKWTGEENYAPVTDEEMAKHERQIKQAKDQHKAEEKQLLERAREMAVVWQEERLKALSDLEKLVAEKKVEMLQNRQNIEEQVFREGHGLMLYDHRVLLEVEFGKMRRYFKEMTDADTTLVYTLYDQLANIEIVVRNLRKDKIVMKKKLSVMGELLGRQEDEKNILAKKMKAYGRFLLSCKQNDERVKKMMQQIQEQQERKKALEEELMAAFREKGSYLEAFNRITAGIQELQAKVADPELRHIYHSAQTRLSNYRAVEGAIAASDDAGLKSAKSKVRQDMQILRHLPSLISRELKSHNDLINAIKVKLPKLGMELIDLRQKQVLNNSFPYTKGPGVVAQY